MNNSNKKFPEDSFDLDKFKMKTLAHKRARLESDGEEDIYSDIDSAIHKEGGSNEFDLDNFKKKVIYRKRLVFWRRNSKLFNLISTLSMIVLFIIAYFAYSFITQLITNYTSLR